MSVHERWKAHLKPSTHKLKGKYKLYNAMNKYGKENFYYEILEENVPIDELNQREIDYIAQYDSYFNGYNSTKGGDGRYFNNKYDVDEIILAYESGTSTLDLSIKYNVHQVTIQRLLRRYGVDLSANYKAPLDMDFIIENYQTMSYKELADKFDVNEATIKRSLHRLGIYKRKTYINHRNNFSVDDFMNDFTNGMCRKEIISKYNISKTTMYRIVKKYKNQ